MLVLNDDAAHRQALERMGELWGAPEDTPEGAELEAIAAAVTEYELRFAMPAANPAEIIRFKLRERGWSQNQLAKAAGLSSGRLSEIVSGRRAMTLRQVRALASALDVPPGVLMGSTEPDHQVVITERARVRALAVARTQGRRFDEVVELALAIGLRVLEGERVDG